MIDLYESFLSRLPLFYVFLSGVGFSCQGLIIKLLSEYGYRSSIHCVIMRGFIQCIMSCIFMHFNVGVKEDEPPPALFGNTNYVRWMLFLRSTTGFGSIAAGYLAVEYIAIGDSTVLIMLSPMIAAILSVFILGEPWKLPEFVATLMSLTGAIFVAKPPFLFGHSYQEQNIDSKTFYTGVFIALFASVNAAFAFIFVRILGTTAKMPWPYVTFSQSLAQLVYSIPLIYFLKIHWNQHFTWTAWGMVFLGGFIGSWSQAAMTIGMQREKSASATAMRMSDVVFGFLWQAIFTLDPVNNLSLFGAVLITSSILVVVIFKPQTPSSSSSSTTIPSDQLAVTNELQAKDNQIEMIEESRFSADRTTNKLSFSEKEKKGRKKTVSEIIAENLNKFSFGSSDYLRQSLSQVHEEKPGPFRYARVSQNNKGEAGDDEDNNNND
jgi:drug/metabolite transporter (DMT)-like permease